MLDYVIIGAGECGARAALALREQGFDGRITLIGSEPHLPYERPPLSKQVLLEGAGPKYVAAAEHYTKADITLLSGHTVSHIRRADHALILDGGRLLNYDKLLLATGARPRPLPGVEFSERVLALRNYEDTLRLRAYLQPGRHLVIAGGGLIGLEVAASARMLGAQVTVLESQPRLLARGVPADIAAVLARRHAAEGVKVLCNVNVNAVNVAPDGVLIALADGRELTADALLVGIGALPNVELAQAAGRVRLESWRNAQEQGILAALNMLGGQDKMASVPWFWSDQYDLSLHAAGLMEDAHTTMRRDIAADALMIFHLDATGRLLAASGIGPGNSIARDIRLAEKLIAARACPAPEALADSAIKLKSLLTRATPHLESA